MPAGQEDGRPAGEGDCHTARVYIAEGSDSAIVPMSLLNKDGKPLAETGEGRALIKENTHQPNTSPTQSGIRVSQGLEGVRKAARESKERRFTALLHHLTVDLLRESFYALKRNAAPGVDGTTWQEYETGLKDRLIDLHRRVHRGAYRAKPSRRVYIPKADGRERPLGVAALEDKIVQHGVVTILNAIYEEDFLGFSYGFRPGRSQHQALDAVSYALLRKKVNYVLDADIRGFFDNLDSGWMLKFVQHRVADRRILRLIQKWLKAAETNRKRRGEGKPETFDFLGFTHMSGKNRHGAFTVRRKTIRKRMRAKLQEIKQQLRRRMHDPMAQTGEWLQSVVQGYFNYHAVPGNLDSLGIFRERVTRLWRWSLRRRGQRRRANWARIHRLAERWLPRPRVLHPYPEQRFAATHPR